jgi:hypothetical protein
MSIETISIRNAQWARKYVVERMRPIYLDQGSVDIMNQFEKRLAAAHPSSRKEVGLEGAGRSHRHTQ